MYSVRLRRILGVSAVTLVALFLAAPAFAQTEGSAIGSWFRFGPVTLCIAGAALDVFAAEPQVPAALMEMENVVLSPHQGSATGKTRAMMGDLVVRNLAAHFSGAPLFTQVA